jgi:hypothetical protein
MYRGMVLQCNEVSTIQQLVTKLQYEDRIVNFYNITFSFFSKESITFLSSLHSS